MLNMSHITPIALLSLLSLACVPPEDRDLDGDGFSAAVDCDDTNDEVHPEAVEMCDGADNDCDGTADMGAADGDMWYVDLDGDGFGGEDVALDSCEEPEGERYTLYGEDCDDTNAARHPGAFEVCDGLDNDCNYLPDDGLTFETWYLDGDGDGHGDPGREVVSCNQPPIGVQAGDDCDDEDDSTYAGAVEACDGIDNDCDGVVPDDEFDDDGDGYAVCDGDCDDTNFEIFPGAGGCPSL